MSPDPQHLQPRLERLLLEARAAWPNLAVDDAAFAAFVAERVADEPDPIAALDAVCAQDLYLACACIEGVPGALAELERHAIAAIPGAMRRLDPSPAFAAEVQQIVRTKLLVAEPGEALRLAGYRGHGRLRGWLMVAALRTGIELQRRVHPTVDPETGLAEATAFDGDPELAQIKHLYRAEFSAAFKTALGQLTSRERNLLRLYVLDGLPIDRIGAVYRVHRATVARWIGKARERLLEETRAELGRTLRLDDTEFESLLAVVRSHLDLSLERCLQKPARQKSAS
jgi:RNA polymerase sigma-70 factor (ECF subfamily)